MSLFDYQASREIEAKGFPFYALIMAAMRQADDTNQRKLADAFPEQWIELQSRYHAKGGKFPGER